MEQSSSGSSSENSSNACINSKRSLIRSSLSIKNYHQLTALICMGAIIFSTFNWSTKENPTPLIAGLYDSLSRVFWSISLTSLIIQLCLSSTDLMDNNGSSLIVRVLSHQIFTTLGRLSFLAYLISPYVNTFILAVEEQSLFPSLFIMFHVIIGNILIIYILSIILAIMIEQPMRRFTKQLMNIRKLGRENVQL